MLRSLIPSAKSDEDTGGTGMDSCPFFPRPQPSDNAAAFSALRGGNNTPAPEGSGMRRGARENGRLPPGDLHLRDRYVTNYLVLFDFVDHNFFGLAAA
jgi:hypothetical protein